MPLLKEQEHARKSKDVKCKSKELYIAYVGSWIVIYKKGVHLRCLPKASCDCSPKHRNHQDLTRCALPIHNKSSRILITNIYINHMFISPSLHWVNFSRPNDSVDQSNNTRNKRDPYLANSSQLSCELEVRIYKDT
jgi:hypothetical protein